MILVLDVGNTNIKIGLFQGERLINSWRFATDLKRTSDEYGVAMESFFHHVDLSTADVNGIIMSSVVPSLNYTIEHMCNLYFPNREVMQVSSSLNTGIGIQYQSPQMLGADRICNVAAAYQSYGGPSIVVDFGTATTFSVVSGEGEFLGGLICPGIIVSTDALVEKAAMLHKVEYIKPERVLCANTKDAIQAGIINGFVGQVDYIIRQIKKELPSNATVIATGGMSSMIARETDCIDVLNPTLTLEGLNRIYRMNC